MTLLARLRSFMAALVRGRTIERDMEDEWRFHVEARADALAAEGVPRDEAVRRARSEFGDPLRWKEGGREARGLRWIYDVAGDLRYGLRQFRRAPLFAVTAVITLALGIGANVAIFSVLNGIILRPLPYPNSRQLMSVSTEWPRLGAGASPVIGARIPGIARGQPVICDARRVYAGRGEPHRGRPGPARAYGQRGRASAQRSRRAGGPWTVVRSRRD